ncbi:ribbon-helix-helix protein, CopG family [Massilia sp. W12]|uniref:CopG family ribbon-helix-helix protein n=1 Tax=Massilia sp. W12 TaxID=3126507 RepID=UPI0030D57C6A
MSTANHRITLHLDAEMNGRLERLADVQQRPASGLMHEAISQYVEREEKRETFRQDALQAWEDFRSSGLHVSAEEADAWLAELEQGKDSEPPVCHV